MPKVDKLLYLAIVPPTLISASVLTFVVFIHDIGNLTELFITRNASLGVIATIAATILPGILIFSLPLAFLVGILVGLSGLSGESQITALRACGVPLRTMLRSIVLFGVLIGSITGFLSLFVLPRTNDILQTLRDRISLKQATSQIHPRVFNEDFPNLVVYLDDLALDREEWSRIFLVDNTDPKALRTVLAKRGTWIAGAGGMRLQLHLENGTVYEYDPGNPGKDSTSVFERTDIPIQIVRGAIASPESSPARPRKPIEQTTAELWVGRQNTPRSERLAELVELHRRLAIPFATIPFALLGLTLGISTKKGGRASGFAMGLALVLLFYVLFFNGIRLASVDKLPPWLGAWGANLLLGALGLAMLVKAESVLGLAHWLGGLRWISKTQALVDIPVIRKTVSLVKRVDLYVLRSTAKATGLRFPKILDIYISRGFLVYFFWSLITCGVLFVLLTLFDLLDDIIRNRIPVSSVIDYFAFLTPQILMLVVPMSVLLGILINFGVLEKNSEVTAIKAGGWSLYRVAVPVVLIAIIFCFNMYLLQDYVLPYANIRQDSLRNVIKGRPAQSSMRPQRKWIFGSSNHIYNYDYFDSSQNLFIDLNIYQLDLKAPKLLQRYHAERATLDEAGKWRLQNGWFRDFQTGVFETIQEATFQSPEKPGYFEKEIFQPKESSKMTYLELKDYISYLKQSGYNANDLQVELYKKISFPLSCAVMALLGVPFSFSTGKKGAFFGIGLSIAIAMSYWGVYGVFEKMGTYGLLVPALAAWAPNILFGAAGLVLLFTIRT